MFPYSKKYLSTESKQDKALHVTQEQYGGVGMVTCKLTSAKGCH